MHKPFILGLEKYNDNPLIIFSYRSFYIMITNESSLITNETNEPKSITNSNDDDW